MTLIFPPTSPSIVSSHGHFVVVAEAEVFLGWERMRPSGGGDGAF